MSSLSKENTTLQSDSSAAKEKIEHEADNNEPIDDDEPFEFDLPSFEKEKVEQEVNAIEGRQPPIQPQQRQQQQQQQQQRLQPLQPQQQQAVIVIEGRQPPKQAQQKPQQKPQQQGQPPLHTEKRVKQEGDLLKERVDMRAFLKQALRKQPDLTLEEATLLIQQANSMMQKTQQLQQEKPLQPLQPQQQQAVIVIEGRQPPKQALKKPADLSIREAGLLMQKANSMMQKTQQLQQEKPRQQQEVIVIEGQPQQLQQEKPRQQQEVIVIEGRQPQQLQQEKPRQQGQPPLSTLFFLNQEADLLRQQAGALELEVKKLAKEALQTRAQIQTQSGKRKAESG